MFFRHFGFQRCWHFVCLWVSNRLRQLQYLFQKSHAFQYWWILFLVHTKVRQDQLALVFVWNGLLVDGPSLGLL